MKKILFALIAVMSFAVAQAQVPTRNTKTITAADTITVSNIGSNVTGLQYTYTESSGTTAGKVYFEVSIDNVGWAAIDSITLADVATAQTKIVNVTNTYFTSARWRNTNTSSATGVVYAFVLRRPDEK